MLGRKLIDIRTRQSVPKGKTESNDMSTFGTIRTKGNPTKSQMAKKVAYNQYKHTMYQQSTSLYKYLQYLYIKNYLRFTVCHIKAM